MQEATKLRELLERKRQFEKIPGETRKLIAERLGTTPAQVGRYDSIEKHLLPRFKELLAGGKVNVSVAYELSTLAENEQCAALMDYLTTGALSIEDVKKRKMAEREHPPVQPGPMVTMVTMDEVGPAPTPEQTKELLKRDRPACKAVILPEKPEDEVGAPKVRWQDWQEHTAEESAGKVADLSAPPSPPPVPDAPEPDQTPERMSEKQAAYILEDLQVFCEEMLGIDAEQPETWAQRADALTVAIGKLRRK